VCIDENDNVPLRGRRASKIYKIAEKGFLDNSGFKIPKN